MNAQCCSLKPLIRNTTYSFISQHATPFFSSKSSSSSKCQQHLIYSSHSEVIKRGLLLRITGKQKRQSQNARKSLVTQKHKHTISGNYLLGGRCSLKQCKGLCKYRNAALTFQFWGMAWFFGIMVKAPYKLLHRQQKPETANYF